MKIKILDYKINGGVIMSRLITCFLIIASLISYLYAYGAMPQQDEAFQNSAGPKDKQSELTGGMAPKMSKVVDKLLTNAETLQLTEKQKESLSMIPDKYIYPLRKKEADYDIARMKVNNLMQDPNFDIAQVKEETKILEETALDMANISIDAIGEIRSAIGIENFKTILSMLGQK
jgi:Spy/CpxP family protein refolding chaperone